MNIITQENLNLISTAVIVPLVIVIGKYAINFMEIKIAQLKEKVTNEKIKKCLEVAEDAVKTAVIAVTQTYVDNIKKQGKVFFDKEQQSEAFKLAKEQALAIISAKTMSALQEELSTGEIDIWINSKIEQYVKLSK